MAYRRQRCVAHDRLRLPPAAPRAHKNRLTTLERTPNNDKSEERQEPTRSPFPMFLGARSLASAGWSEFFFFIFFRGGGRKSFRLLYLECPCGHSGVYSARLHFCLPLCWVALRLPACSSAHETERYLKERPPTAPLQCRDCNSESAKLAATNQSALERNARTKDALNPAFMSSARNSSSLPESFRSAGEQVAVV